MRFYKVKSGVTLKAIMCYLKTLFFNFFIVFFAIHIVAGIDVANQTKLPHIGGDLMFALGLGFINSLVYPLLKICNRATSLKIAGLSAAFSFIACAILKLLPIGIHVTSFMGYFSAAILVSIGSFLTNWFEMKHARRQCTPSAPPPMEEFHQMLPK